MSDPSMVELSEMLERLSLALGASIPDAMITFSATPSSSPVLAHPKSLSDLLQTLPQELLDEIRGWVFTPDSSPKQIRITRNYTPPSNMQVNKETRKVILHSHYSMGAVEILDDRPGAIRYFDKWIASLSPEVRLDLQAHRQHANIFHYRPMKKARFLHRRLKQQNSKRPASNDPDRQEWHVVQSH
ncbi:uncharacterized protein RCC_08711 [Ramularia collo-cygni]|uniref:Uncharacterized protein n=1 Tax=Ramularia collo-cygni TaxID=112498 RepID=A0A2D3V4T8_9PEZI|nr:uncharacterized protein RCC_08711 [Ramularia collo-cygni]CZT23003.1 uncharacterized protein RCC_08711 [Ramularia collo-cygni]